MKPVEINASIDIKKGEITVNKNCVNAVVASLNSLLWCFQNKKAENRGEGSCGAGDTDTDSENSEDEDLENFVKDKLYGQKQQQQQPPDFPEIDEGMMMAANDEYINSLEEELETIENDAKDSSPTTSSSPQPLSSSATASSAGGSTSASVIPVIRVGVTCENLAVSFVELANIELKQLQLGLLVDPEPQKKHGRHRTTGNITIVAEGSSAQLASSPSTQSSSSSVSSSLDSMLQDPAEFFTTVQYRQTRDEKGSKRIVSSFKMSTFTFDITIGGFSVVSALPEK